MNAISSSLIGEQTALPIENSPGKRKHRISFSILSPDEERRYSIACKPLFIQGDFPPQLGVIERWNTVLLKVSIDQQNGYVKVNAASLRKRLAIDMHPFNQALTSTENFSPLIFNRIKELAPAIIEENPTAPMQTEAFSIFASCSEEIHLSKTDSEIRTDPEIRTDYIRYHSPQKKQNITRQLGLSSEKKPLGEGHEGSVHQLKDRPNQVIKKIIMRNGKATTSYKQFEIGNLLNHTSFVKIHQLYIKEKNNCEVHKLLMDKIDGATISDRLGTNAIEKKYSLSCAKLLIEQAKNACLYLFDQKISWKDLNHPNIFVNEKNQLTLCDFECWEKQSDVKKLTTDLLIGSMELIYWLVRGSNSVSLKDMKNIFLPNSLFDEDIRNKFSNRIDSLLLSVSRRNALADAFRCDNKDYLRNYLDEYFETVLSLLKPDLSPTSLI